MPTYEDLPGPRKWPLLGVGASFQIKGCDYLCQLANQYGRIVKFPLPGIKGVLVSDKELIKIILLQSERQFYKGPLYKILEPVVGKGLVTNQGPSWRQKRRQLNPIFLPENLPESLLNPILDRACSKLCEKIEQSIFYKEPLNSTQALMELTFSILVETFFLRDASLPFKDLGIAFNTIQEWIGSRFVSPFRPPLSIPTLNNLKLKKALKSLEETLNHFLNLQPSNQNFDQDIPVSINLLNKLLSMKDPETNQPLPRKEILDEVITFLIAGHDTTALTLSYTLALFAENQSFMNPLIQGLNSSSPTSYQDAALKLELGILESMRIYPAVYMINRANKEPFSYKQYHFPAHTTFFTSQFVTHRDPDYWPDPLAFKPDRFEKGIPDDFSFFPFAGGPRTCIGNHLAMIEAKGVLLRVLKHFKPIKVHKKFKITPQLTSIPKPYVTLWWEKSTSS